MTNQHPIADCVFMSPLQDDGACVDDLTSLWARSSRFGFGLELILYAVVFYFWCVCVRALTSSARFRILMSEPQDSLFLRKLAKCA